MNDILNSLQNITATPFFWGALGSAVAWGMYIGAKRNHGFKGLRGSLEVILPFAGFLLVSTIATTWQYAETYGLGWQSYNNSLRLIIFTIAYTFGLWVGHIVWCRAVHHVLKDEPDEIRTKVLQGMR